MIHDFELLRVALRPEGVFGVLKHQGLPFAVTLEHSYEENKPKIPTGLWRCKRTWFQRGSYRTYEVMDVPGHSRLLFHRGNLEADTDGCILVAEQFGLLRGAPGVLSSSNGFAEFMSLVGVREEFWLLVREA
jgi:hypothetical protein